MKFLLKEMTIPWGHDGVVGLLKIGILFQKSRIPENQPKKSFHEDRGGLMTRTRVSFRNIVVLVGYDRNER